MSSRAALNAKLVKRHQQRQAATQARTNTNKFSQKQSHYELRREEEQARQVQQHAATSFLTSDAGSGAAGNESHVAAAASVRQVGDGLLRSRWGTDGNVNSTSAQQWSPMRLQTQPLSRHALHGTDHNGNVTNMKKAAAATGSTRDGHLFVGGSSVARPRSTTTPNTHTRMSAEATPAVQRSLVKPRSAKADHLSTRSTRRLSRFHLSEDNITTNTHTMDAATHGEGDDDEMEENVQKGSALGQRRARALTSLAARQQEQQEEEEEPPRKLTKQEKFYEVIANSKEQRAQQQRERQDRDAMTKELDAEINALMHLLPRRDPEEEERSAFVQSGNAEVRALLAKYKKNHVAKQVSLKASGEAIITPLTQVHTTTLSAKSVREEVAKRAQGPSSVAAITTAEHIHDKKKDEEEEEDDFDAMLQRMSLDPRRAHATERLLDEAEVAAQALQQQVLQEDRQALPRLALQEKEQLQQTRREWLREGGNAAVQMDDLDKEIQQEEKEGEGSNEGDDNAFSDNADLPSSYEGDSEEENHTTTAADEEEEEEMDDKEESRTRSGDAAVAALLSAPNVSRSHDGLDKLLTGIEAIAHTNTATTSSTQEKEMNTIAEEKKEEKKSVTRPKAELEAEYGALVRALYRYATQHLLEVAQVFRALLIEAEKDFLRGSRRPPSRAILLYLHTATLLFPASDFRHAVMTPLLLFLCSTLAQLKLTTLEDVHGAVWLSALLVQCLRNGCNKFCAEVIVSLLNVLALQLSRGVLEPARFQTLRVPFPLLDRCEPALLTNTKTANKDKTNEKGNEGSEEDEEGDAAAVPDFTHGPLPIGLLDTSYDAEALLLSAYRLLCELADMYRTVPAFATMLTEPFDALDALLTRNAKHEGKAAGMSRAVCAAHTALRTRLHAYAQEANEHRTPLAMRSFRPRPLRQYDPLLAETAEHAVRSETKELKRGLREDKKRLVRHLKAEATVQRRAYEKEGALVAAQRERQYHVVLGQLQAQQHAMNTVDAMMAKAKSKPRKGLSGAPKTAGAEDGGGGGAMGGE